MAWDELIESEPPKAEGFEKTDAIRISASGAYYWQYLVRSFAYLDLVYLDTPLADRTACDRLVGMASVSDLSVRFERVRIFLDYLAREEEQEILEVAKRSGPYTGALIPQIRERIELEIDDIAKRTGATDLQDE